MVVTGGASGIGLATACRFQAEGARVMIFDRSEEALASARDQHEFAGLARVDVSRAGQVGARFADVDQQLGGIDVLIANAGISSRYSLLDLPADEWQRMLDTNLSGVFYCVQEAARRMLANEGGGVILVTASTNAMTAHPGYVHYNASKAGLLALVRTAALELAPKVRINAICPGYVLTPMQQAEYTREMLDEVDRSIPLGRHATPDEIAALFAFLASPEAAYITGQSIVIDGGEIA